MDLDSLAAAFLIGAAIVLAAIIGVRWVGKLGLPGLLLYLLLGVVIGESFPSLNFADAGLATVLGYAALAIILAEGGLTTRVADLRPVLGPSVVLATVGVAVSIAVVALPLMWIAGLDARPAILIGAVLAATDAAAVFSVLRKLRLHPRLRSLLEAEAGFNDAPVVVLVVVIATGSVSAEQWWLIPLIVAGELVGGAIVGVVVGYLAKWGLPRLALPAVGLYPIAVMAILLGAYGLADVLHTSGFLATYIAGVIVGSTKNMPHRRNVVGFAEGMAWSAEIGLFVMLGLLANPVRAIESAWPALVAGIALVFFARPIGAAVSLLPFRLPLNWIGFVGLAGLRGAVPIVFATIALGAQIAGADVVFDTTLLLVVVLTFLQTPTLPWLGRKLGVEESGQADDVDVESAPLDKHQAALLNVDVDDGSQLVGLYLADLGLPDGAVVSLVFRAEEALVPDKFLRLRAGDRLLVVTADSVRTDTERRLRAVSQRGRLADWYATDPES